MTAQPAPHAMVTVADLIVENRDLQDRVTELEAHLARLLALPATCPVAEPRPCTTALRSRRVPGTDPTERLGGQEGTTRLAAAAAEVHEWAQATADRRRRLPPSAPMAVTA